MRHAALFDLDGTLLRGESQFAFLLWCLRRGVAPRLRAIPVIAQYASYLTGISRNALALRESGFRLFREISVENIEREANDFFQADLSRRFRRQAMPLIEAHRAEGHLIVILTSACRPIANLVATSVRADELIATRLLVNDGRFNGQREMPEPYGNGKSVLVERLCQTHGLCVGNCFAYTDHHSDVGLLETVGHPVVVNPTPKLQAIAMERGWRQISLDGEQTPDIRFHKGVI